MNQIEELRDDALDVVAGGAGGAMDPNGDQGSMIDPDGRKR